MSIVVIGGVAIPFNNPSYDDYMSVSRDAFTEDTDYHNAVLMTLHDSLTLASVVNGTLKLSVGSDGLMFEASVDTSREDGRVLVDSIRARESRFVSIGCVFDSEEASDGSRMITRMYEVHDVSIVPEPYFRGTSVRILSEEVVSDDNDSSEAGNTNDSMLIVEQYKRLKQGYKNNG